MPNGNLGDKGGRLPPPKPTPILRRQVTPIDCFDGEHHIINGQVGGMMLTCYGVRFGAGNQSLDAQYENEKAVLAGASIVSIPPSEMPRT